MTFTFPSYGNWTETSKDEIGDTYYLDFDRIREIDGYVYFWHLHDYLNPSKYNFLSTKEYLQGDCKLFRIKFLDGSVHKKQMGKDLGFNSSLENIKWMYPRPNSPMEKTLNLVCNSRVDLTYDLTNTDCSTYYLESKITLNKINYSFSHTEVAKIVFP